MNRKSRALPPSPFRRFNSSPEVIRLVVMMYVRFPLSLRNVEDLLAERGIDICHETVRLWWNRFGPLFAGDIRRQRVSRMRGFRHWRWHLDEMYVKLNGEMVYLWRAVDHEGEVLESYVTKTRDKEAALRFMKKALKRHGSPEAITTDGLRSYRAAMTELGNAEKQEIGRWANNRVENSHLPFRRRERAMLRFRQMKTLQKFASVHANVHNLFSLERHLVDRQTYKDDAPPRWRSGRALQAEPRGQSPRCIVWRAVRLRLTAPYVKLNGEMVYLWRAVDHEGEVLESYVTRTRDKAAALAFMKKALKRHGSPEAITTDGLRSYRAAMTELGNAEKQEIGRWANNRVENSHVPFRRRERAMLRFRQMKTLQKFASVHANVHNHFSLERHLVDRQTYKQRRSAALAEWQSLAS